MHGEARVKLQALVRVRVQDRRTVATYCGVTKPPMDTASCTTINLCGTLGVPVGGAWLIAFIAASSKDVREIPPNSSALFMAALYPSLNGRCPARCCPSLRRVREDLLAYPTGSLQYVLLLS